MVLDLNKKELRYIWNSEDCGVAFRNIEDTSYRAVVSFYDEDYSIKLLQYTNNQHVDVQQMANEEVEKKCSECDKWMVKYQEAKEEIAENKSNMDLEKAMMMSLREENERLKSEMDTLNEESNRKIAQFNGAITVKDAEIQKLSKSNIELNAECKELSHELVDVKGKYNALLRKININEDDYMKWDSDTIVDWIIGLDDSYQKYEEVLRKNLKEEEVDGASMNEFEKSDLHRWGITKFKDKGAIMREIARIKEKAQKSQQEIAIAAPAPAPAPAPAYSQSHAYQNDGPDVTNYINR